MAGTSRVTTTRSPRTRERSCECDNNLLVPTISPSDNTFKNRPHDTTRQVQPQPHTSTDTTLYINELRLSQQDTVKVICRIIPQENSVRIHAHPATLDIRTSELSSSNQNQDSLRQDLSKWIRTTSTLVPKAEPRGLAFQSPCMAFQLAPSPVRVSHPSPSTMVSPFLLQITRFQWQAQWLWQTFPTY